MHLPSFLLVILLIQISSTLSFMGTRTFHTSSYTSKQSTSDLLASSAEAPSTVNSRLKVSISGPSISSALFRAELKKELCFFRGCRASFISSDSLTGVSELICEGKTVQISRFITWLEALSVEVSNRKANFQGPSLVAYIDKIAWEEYKVEIMLFHKNNHSEMLFSLHRSSHFFG